MTETPDPGEMDREERLRDEMGIRSETWKQTNQEMQLLAEERREEGWEVVTMPTVHTSIVPPDLSEDEAFGIEYVIPDNYTEEFTDAFEPEEFTEYQVYRTTADGNVFQLLELMAPDSETAVLIIGMYERRHTQALREPAWEQETLYTIVRTMDGTRLGLIKHEEFEPLLPEMGGD